MRRFDRAFGIALLFLGAAPSVTACHGVDPLYGYPNGRGDYFIDADAGGGKRIICIGRSGARERCSIASARVLIEAVSDPAQLQADWSSDETLQVYLFGGTILRCSSAAGGIRIELRRSPSANPTPGRWSDAHFALFDGLPDVCTAHVHGR